MAAFVGGVTTFAARCLLYFAFLSLDLPLAFAQILLLQLFVQIRSEVAFELVHDTLAESSRPMKQVEH